MNKRQIQKKKTRELILQVAKKEFIKKGFLDTTTSEISKKAEIAHGTLFLHFKNKETLIIEILDKELESINTNIFKLISKDYNLERLLSQYLNLLQKEEDLFVVLARELPFYSDKLRRKILFRDSIIRNHFHKAIESGIKEKRYRDIDVTSAIIFLFGTINYYLSLKPIFVKEGSVIKKFKSSIIKTFKKLIL
ncbi:MAG: TetR/AcrR family transcriptional regulator [Candidatus Cloacimonetes bacterium]|jgi:AcrR family transcriptional regulator|nr:TetR/AcrR family transcriptional regulator [Candidatus Cloacimonadota bacterium]